MAENKVFVGGLWSETTRDSLHSQMAEFGEILEAKIVMDRQTGRSKGFGFVCPILSDFWLTLQGRLPIQGRCTSSERPRFCYD